MSGPFAHMTLVGTICQKGNMLDSIPTLTDPMKRALTVFFKYCELGAVSPDLPYLDLPDKDAQCWGNVMHYWKTVDFIRHAIPHLKGLGFQTIELQKLFAWLLGYTAHVVTDFSIHPFVNQIAGPYDDSNENRKKHRLCEMNQDVYIFETQKGNS